MSDFEYANAPESKAIANISPSYGLFIGGKFVDPKKGKSFSTINPANEELLSKVGYGDKSDIDAAVKSARAAYTKIWSKMPAKERGKYLYRIARIMQERAREFAVVETLDNGKPIRESRDTDIPLAAAHFFYHAGWADKLEYAGFGNKPKSLGVVGQIIPWNFPLLMLAWKIAPALAAGNTVVLKPAETTPLTALLFAQVCQQAGLPDGVVNIVTGDGITGAALVNHPDINKVAFTGSTEVGKAIARSISATKKTATLELGGKAANLVFEDAAIDEAVEGIVNGIFFNQGHVCCAGSRLIIQENVADEVLEKLKKRMSLIRVGDPMDKNTDLGAINSKEQLNKIEEISKTGDAEGANRWSPDVKLPTKGFWYPPTIFTGVTQSHRIAREEIFGPVVSVMTFDDEADAIRKANDTEFGLSGSIWTNNSGKAIRVARAVESGNLSVNSNSSVRYWTPFGGYKQSGLGRELGPDALDSFTEVKNVFIATDN